LLYLKALGVIERFEKEEMRRARVNLEKMEFSYFGWFFFFSSALKIPVREFLVYVLSEPWSSTYYARKRPSLLYKI
jgi:hypothetical protein